MNGLAWSGQNAVEILLVDDRHDLTPCRSLKMPGGECVVEQDLTAWSVCVVAIRAGGNRDEAGRTVGAERRGAVPAGTRQSRTLLPPRSVQQCWPG
jgi:hypothetical protein